MDYLPLVISFIALLLGAAALLMQRDVRRELASIGEAAAKGVNTRKEVRELCDEMETVLDKLYHQEARERMRRKRAEKGGNNDREQPTEEQTEVDALAELIQYGTSRGIGVRS